MDKIRGNGTDEILGQRSDSIIMRYSLLDHLTKVKTSKGREGGGRGWIETMSSPAPENGPILTSDVHSA